MYKEYVMIKDGLNTLPSGTTMWFLNGINHNDQGPSIIHKDYKVYYFYGYKITDKEDIALFPLNDEDKIYLKLKYGV